MSETLSTLINLLTLTFVVTSMFSFGLRLTLKEIIEPLRDLRLVFIALLVNFVILPLAALLLAAVLGLAEELRIGLILMSSVAGAALVPKLAQIAKGNVPLAVALTALLVAATVIYLPLALPLMLPEVQVDTPGIAIRLSVQVLLPLALGLLVDSIYKEEADALLPILGQISNVSLVLMIALMLGGNMGNVINLLGTGSLIAIVLLLAIAMAAGYLLGGPDTASRRTLALSAGQRNLAAAMVVATGNFANRPDVFVFLAAAGLVGMIVVIPVVGQFQKSTQKAEGPAASAAGWSSPAADEQEAVRNPRARK